MLFPVGAVGLRQHTNNVRRRGHKRGAISATVGRTKPDKSSNVQLRGPRDSCLNNQHMSYAARKPQSRAEAEANARTLRNLVKQPENKVCADCKRNDTRWASWNIGCFLCIRCSGIHRSMGTHISRVKSIDLDMWTTEQMESMKKWGNKLVNLYWEANLKPGHMPPDHKVESFIRSKVGRVLTSVREPSMDFACTTSRRSICARRWKSGCAGHWCCFYCCEHIDDAWCTLCAGQVESTLGLLVRCTTTCVSCGSHRRTDDGDGRTVSACRGATGRWPF